MKFEYQEGNLYLTTLNSDCTNEILNFYKRNADYFEPYETDKPDNFYTKTFIKNLVDGEFNAFIKKQHARFYLFDANKSDSIIGCVSFSDIKHGSFKSCVIGYKIDHNFQRQGYGSKMLKMALKIMAEEFDMHRIEAYILPDNAASIGLAKKMSFIEEGIAHKYVLLNGKWTDHLRYVYIS